MVPDEERIRQRAHQIWEEEGRPEGRAAEHWDRACREVAAEMAVNGAAPADDALPSAAKPKRAPARRKMEA